MITRSMEPQKLEAYALADEWKPVDKFFSSAKPEELAALVPFARQNLSSPNGNLQDLGATIFQKYTGVITLADRKLLMQIIENPGNPFARYRAGFALWIHGEKSDYVKSIIEEAKTCADVASIARKLLKK